MFLHDAAFAPDIAPPTNGEPYVVVGATAEQAREYALIPIGCRYNLQDIIYGNQAAKDILPPVNEELVMNTAIFVFHNGSQVMLLPIKGRRDMWQLPHRVALRVEYPVSAMIWQMQQQNVIPFESGSFTVHTTEQKYKVITLYGVHFLTKQHTVHIVSTMPFSPFCKLMHPLDAQKVTSGEHKIALAQLCLDIAIREMSQESVFNKDTVNMPPTKHRGVKRKFDQI